jgi:hypothetical protein
VVSRVLPVATHPGRSGADAPQSLSTSFESPSGGLSENWLPIIDSFRTLCLAPPREVRTVFDDVRALTLAS